jgi:hypothetical protein
MKDELTISKKKGPEETSVFVPLLPGISAEVDIEEPEGGRKTSPLVTVGDFRDFYIVKAREMKATWVPTQMKLHEVTLSTPLQFLDQSVYLGRLNNIHISVKQGGGFFRTDSQQPSDIHQMIDLILAGLKKQGIPLPHKIVPRIADQKTDQMMADYCRKIGVQYESLYKETKKTAGHTPKEVAETKEASFKIPGPGRTG